MLSLQRMFVAFAAFLAVQISLNPCTAGEAPEENDLDLNKVENDIFSTLFGDSFLARSTSQLEEILKSLFEMPEASQLLPGPAALHQQMSVSLPDEKEKSCQLGINMDSSLQITEIKVGIESGNRRLIVKFTKDQSHQKNDEGRGEFLFSRHVDMSESVLLPENCIAIPELGGYLVDSEKNRALVVFPGSKLLKEQAEAGLLPEAIVDILESEDEGRKAELSPEQLCLAAGFTLEQCEKLGNKRPALQEVPFPDGDDVVPLGRYEASLQMLD